MFIAIFKRVAALFGPGGLVLSLLLWFISRPSSLYWLPVLRLIAPVFFGGMVVFLALRFGMRRLFYGATVLAMALFWVLMSRPDSFAELFIILCLDFVIFSLMPPGRKRRFDTAVRFSLLLLQFPLLALFLRKGDMITVALARWPNGFRLGGEGMIMAAIILFAVYFFFRSLREKDVQVAGFFWISVAMAISLGGEKALVTPEQVVYLIGPALLFVVCLEGAYDLAFRDRLTGLAGRRAMDDFLRRRRPPFVVAMVDIDFFKKFNDKFGHDVGDQVLAKVASLIALVSGGGRPFRYGGEEFAIVFPGLAPERVEAHLERLRGRVEDEGFTVRGKRKNGKGRGRGEGGRRVGLTVSIGFACGRRGEPAEAIMKKADQALYRAKSQGRNRVCGG